MNKYLQRGFLIAVFLVSQAPAGAQVAAIEKDETQLLTSALPFVRAERSDLGVLKGRYLTPLVEPGVESLLEDPLSLPSYVERIHAELSGARNSRDYGVFTQTLFGAAASHVASSSAVFAAGELSDIPASLSVPIAGIMSAIRQARPMVEQAVASLPLEKRFLAIETAEKAILGGSIERSRSQALSDANSFDRAAMLSAYDILASAVDDVLPKLKEAARTKPRITRRRVATSAGIVLICGDAQDDLTADDLKDVVLLVKLGGSSSYRAAAADAGEGQIKIVIDLSERLEMKVEPGQGRPVHGRLGIGLLYAPNAVKGANVEAGDFSLGSGLFGVGGLFIEGQNVHISGHRFTIGAGAFGLGVFSVRGDGADLSARQTGLGFGFTRGVGLLAVSGHKSRISAGLYYPDQRDARGLNSQCLGAGLGPRSFAGGGFGLAWLDGDDGRFETSWEGAGRGYWHALGGVLISGRRNTLTSRYYAMGAGIHDGVGFVSIRGDENDLRNNDVGPAYAWDRSVAGLHVRGNQNIIAANAYSGHGEIGGTSLVTVLGDDNTLVLPHFPSALNSRGLSFALGAVSGKGNRLRAEVNEASSMNVYFPTPSGVLVSEGLALASSLSPRSVDWPKAPAREALVEAEKKTNESKYLAAEAKPRDGKLADWLDILSGSAYDHSVADKVLDRLVSLSPEEGSALVSFIDERRMDDFFYIRFVLPAFGQKAAAALVDAAAGQTGRKRAMLTGLLGIFGAGPVLTPIYELLVSTDFNHRRVGAETLGGVFSRHGGVEPGRLSLLEQTLRLVDGDGSAKKIAEALTAMGARRFTDLFSTLALDPDFPAEDRRALLEKAPSLNDLFSPATTEIGSVYARIARARKASLRPALLREIDAVKKGAPTAHAALLQLINDPEPAVVASALAGLCAFKDGSDAGLVVSHFHHPAAIVRESAAFNVGKLGKLARRQLATAMKAEEPRVRSLAAEAAAQSADPEVVLLLEKSFQDKEADVRLTAISALDVIQGQNLGLRQNFKKTLQALAEKDPASSVKQNARLAVARYFP